MNIKIRQTTNNPPISPITKISVAKVCPPVNPLKIAALNKLDKDPIRKTGMNFGTCIAVAKKSKPHRLKHSNVRGTITRPAMIPIAAPLVKPGSPKSI